MQRKSLHIRDEFLWSDPALNTRYHIPYTKSAVPPEFPAKIQQGSFILICKNRLRLPTPTTYIIINNSYSVNGGSRSFLFLQIEQRQ